MSLKFQRILLGGIVVLALYVRLFDLTSNPPGVFADEAIIGNAAFSLIETGKDAKGAFLPLFPYTDVGYRNPLEVYPLIPFIVFFGKNILSIRLASAFFSVSMVIVAYFLGKKLCNTYLGICIAAVFAVTPWLVHFGRTGFLAQNVFLFFILIGCTATLYAFSGRRSAYFIALFSFMLSTYTYYPARFISPLLVVGVIYMFHRAKLHRNSEPIGILCVVLMLIPIIMHTLTPEGAERWYLVASLDSGIYTWIIEFIQKYIRHFSLDFLFLLGDAGMPGQAINRHSILGIGQLYLFQFPLIVVGGYWLLKKRYGKELGFLILLLILYPLGSSVTVDSTPQATRSIFGAIPMCLMSGVGLYAVIHFFRVQRKLSRYAGIVPLVLWIGLSVLYMNTKLEAYAYTATNKYGWNYGFKEIISLTNRYPVFENYWLSSYYNAPNELLSFLTRENTCRNCKIVNLMQPEIFHSDLYILTPQEVSLLGRMNQERSQFSKIEVVETVYFPHEAGLKNNPAFMALQFIE